MKRIEIKTPDGKIIELTAPDDATPEMIQEKAMQAKTMYQQNQQPQPTEAKKPSAMDMAMSAGKQAALTAINPLKQQEVIDDLANMAGERTAEGIAGEFPSLPPQIPAAAGLAVSEAPNLIGGAVGVARRALLARGAKVAAKGAAEGLVGARKGIVEGVKKGADMVFGQGKESAQLAAKEAAENLQNRLVNQARALGQVPLQSKAREAALFAEKQALGKAIGQAEDVGGFAIKETPDSFQDLMKDHKALNKMANTLRKAHDTGSEVLAKTVDTTTLNTMRKFAQTFREIGPEVGSTIKANIAMGGHAATDALKRVDKTFGSVLDEWGRVAKQLDRIPNDTRAQKAAIQAAMRNTRLAVMKTKRYYDSAIAAGAKRDQLRGALGKALGGGSIVAALLGRG